MNQTVKVFILCLCFSTIACEWYKRDLKGSDAKSLSSPKDKLLNRLQSIVSDKKGEELTKGYKRAKRQVGVGIPKQFTGGFGAGFGMYDYNDYYGDYTSDYNYDYYDWVCTDEMCQLCDVLTGECCDPDVDVNCFLPDSCINNPCLGGGTCITTTSLHGQPDFICVCLPGLTGKYCQLVNDYFIGADIVDPIMLPPPPPQPQQAYGGQSYSAPQPAYQAPAPQPAYQAPAPQPAYQAPAPKPAYETPAPAYQAPKVDSYGGAPRAQFAGPAAAAPTLTGMGNDGQFTA